MKKVIACVVIIASVLLSVLILLTGCGVSVAEADTLGRFKIEHADTTNLYDELTVISDSETGVMYLIYDGSNGSPGGITVMVDENGKPLISNEYLGE